MYALALTDNDAARLAGQAKKAKVKRTKVEKGASKHWAVTHGLKHGGHGGDDAVPMGQPPSLDLLADDEGLLAFVQSVTCRRKVWAKIFECAQEPREYNQRQWLLVLYSPSL